jgi:cell division protein FtsI (penicillin-binding protein 3)
VQRVRTGEILAMASRPAYDPNEFRTTEPLSRLNRAIGCVYEPGSTLKAATISAALNEGTVSPATVFDCESGAWSYAQRVLHDVHPYGPLTVADGVKKSSNILTAKVALTLGPERLHRYLRAFGLGAPLRVDLPGEEAGIVRPLRTWSAVDPTRIAIGQGVSVTALQMLGVICAIANDGVLMRPYVVSSVSRADGGALLRRGPEVLSRPIRPDTAAVMRGLLARVTEDGGTGTKARVEGYEVAGKTGTAQKPVNGVYGDECVASFVGFLPARSPRIAAIVVVDEPQAERMGGAVAAPLFSRIAGEAVRCLDIPPDPRNAVVVARARPRGGPEEP